MPWRNGLRFASRNGATMTESLLTLPDGTKRTLAVVLDAAMGYARNYPAVFDLYDRPNGGPHDDVLPIDILAPNALNAWGSGQPMTAMTEAWAARERISRVVAPISQQPLEQLSDALVAAEVEKVGAALDIIDAIPWYGSTATSKFFHRLRPNLGPIWDARVGKWYPEKDWARWVERVYAEVRDEGTQSCLIAARDRVDPSLSLLRVWDLLLWQWAADLA